MVEETECALGEGREEVGILFICSTRFIYAVTKNISVPLFALLVSAS